MPELRGKMYVKKDTDIVTETFKKRDFVIETIEQYPQKIPFQLKNDKVSLLDAIQLGQEVTVSFNFSGREVTKPDQETKFFLNLDAWKIL